MFPDRIDHHVRPRRRKPVKYASPLSRFRSSRKGLAPPAGTNLCSVTRVYPEITPESHAHSPAQPVLSKNLHQPTAPDPFVKCPARINISLTTCCEYMVNNSRTSYPAVTSDRGPAVNIFSGGGTREKIGSNPSRAGHQGENAGRRGTLARDSDLKSHASRLLRASAIFPSP
jgi:hypothetical protein